MATLQLHSSHSLLLLFQLFGDIYDLRRDFDCNQLPKKNKIPFIGLDPVCLYFFVFTFLFPFQENNKDVCLIRDSHG